MDSKTYLINQVKTIKTDEEEEDSGIRKIDLNRMKLREKLKNDFNKRKRRRKPARNEEEVEEEDCGDLIIDSKGIELNNKIINDAMTRVRVNNNIYEEYEKQGYTVLNRNFRQAPRASLYICDKTTGEIKHIEDM